MSYHSFLDQEYGLFLNAIFFFGQPDKNIIYPQIGNILKNCVFCEKELAF